MSTTDLGPAYVAWCRFRLMSHYWPRIKFCVTGLPDDDLWWREHESNNSVGNLLLHLTGNLRQFVLNGFAGVPDTRDRDREFSERANLPKEALMTELESALLESDRVLSEFDGSRLLEHTTVQGRERPFLEVLSIVVEHVALHTGQIIHIYKMKTGKSLQI